MRELTAGALAVLAGARLAGDAGVPVGPDVVIDSRAVTPGAVFVALQGERVDGHDFAATAVAAGAGAVLVSSELDLDVAQLVVDDTLAGLATLATALVAEAIPRGLVTVGITGSSGKTSTKDLLAQVLAEVGPTVAPIGSFNNEIGVPLTATRITGETRFLVSEMGARGQRHITFLCGIAQPRVGVVVNVGHAHLGEFGSVEAIAQAKGELVEALPADGWAVLNADDPLVSAMATRTVARVASFAVGAEPASGDLRVWAEEVGYDGLQRPTFVLRAAGTDEGAATVQLKVTGAHQVGNALAAAAVALTQGMGVVDVAAALGRATLQSHWRMELHEREDGVLVVNDAYNANPDSMAAALRTVASLRRPHGRLLAVLGDMLELGPDAPAAHREIGALAAALGFDRLIAVGGHANDLVHGAGAGVDASVAVDSDAATAAAAVWLRPADVVLVKASRGLALESVAEQLSMAPEGERE
ncbi:MAG TPA: UDP-N-acetylmuramoyl-tripeptide--D-alanyl-D-alanine ligase [Propionicimonas sp.]|jgi:UDP-N-acetylmuramoyl-tripeptide--D-alanyl-D-alanine ligase